MHTLKVSDGTVQPLPGLGKNRDFGLLSEKRVTKCAREVMRQKYGIGYGFLVRPISEIPLGMEPVGSTARNSSTQFPQMTFIEISLRCDG
jgi:hypothetical protein